MYFIFKVEESLKQFWTGIMEQKEAVVRPKDWRTAAGAAAGGVAMSEGSIPEFPVFQANIPATPFIKLTTNNYLPWTIKMGMLLKSQGL